MDKIPLEAGACSARAVQGKPHTNIVVVQPPALGPESTAMACPNCSSIVSTRVEHASTMKTYIISLLLCHAGCCLCMFLPCCMGSCQAKRHYCPSCDQYLGEYNN